MVLLICRFLPRLLVLCDCVVFRFFYSVLIDCTCASPALSIIACLLAGGFR